MKEMVSIIIPTYNRGEVICRAVQSVLRQTYPWYELIIVDDGSTDNTEERISQMDDGRIRYVRLERNQGASRARNEGIKRSSCEYIAFLDSDDEWTPDKLELQMDKIVGSPENVGMVYCRMRTGENKETICPSYDWPEEVPLEGNLFPLLLWRNLIGTPSVLMKKKCLETAGGFHETLHCLEDWELFLRIAKEWRIGFVDKILVTVNKSAESVSANVRAFLYSRCYMVSLYRQEMTQAGLFSVIENEILGKAKAFGLEEETRKLLDQESDEETEMKKVSVIVPCYNAAQYLDKCIRYLLNQTIGVENMEIILVNDASTDQGETWRKIREYEQMFPDTILAVSLEENLRQGGARNVGVSYASGEYLIFCDADDWLLEETLEHCYHTAKEHQADIVEFLINNVRDHEISVPLEKGDRDMLLEIDTEEKRTVFLMTSCEEFSYGSQKKFYRRSLIQDNHIRFAEHLIFEEPSFMVPVRVYEKRHYFLDEKLYICYLSQGSTVRSEWTKEHKWDNPQVWMRLMEDMEERGLLQQYYPELEYLFFSWGYGWTIRMLRQQRYKLSVDDLKFLVNMVLRLFPNVRQNKYIADINRQEWEGVMLTLLDLEITEESVQVINEVLGKYIKG